MSSLTSLQTESYAIIGACMEVHRRLGRGFLEVVYKDALEYEFVLRDIPFEREKLYRIPYKDIILPRYFQADFVVYDRILLEVKAQSGIIDAHYKQTINYLAVTGDPLALLINFGCDSLEYKRVVLPKNSPLHRTSHRSSN